MEMVERRGNENRRASVENGRFLLGTLMDLNFTVDTYTEMIRKQTDQIISKHDVLLRRKASINRNANNRNSGRLLPNIPSQRCVNLNGLRNGARTRRCLYRSELETIVEENANDLKECALELKIEEENTMEVSPSIPKVHNEKPMCGQCIHMVKKDCKKTIFHRIRKLLRNFTMCWKPQDKCQHCLRL